MGRDKTDNKFEEFRLCKCGCGEKIFWNILYKRDGWAIYKNGHNGNVRRGKHIPDIVHEKLIQYGKLHRRKRFCKCGCNQEILKKGKWGFSNYIKGHYINGVHNIKYRYNKQEIIDYIMYYGPITKIQLNNRFQNCWQQYWKNIRELNLDARNKVIIQKGYKGNIYWTRERIIEHYLSIPLITKYEMHEYKKINYLPDPRHTRDLFGSLDNLAKITSKPFLQPKRINYGKGKNESKILQLLEKEYNKKIIKGYPVQVAKNSFFYLDGYIPELNLAIEIDEQYHDWGNWKNKDKIREEKIKQVIPNIQFLRINEKEFLKKVEI